MNTTTVEALTPDLAVGAFTIFRNSDGLLTKTAQLDSTGALQIAPAATLARGTFRVVSAPTTQDLIERITALSTSEALTWGIPCNGLLSGEVVTQTRAKGASPRTIARTAESFTWGLGSGWLMLDFDLKDIAAPTQKKIGAVSLARLREILVEAAPDMADVPMVALPSASALLYSDSGEQLRGFTGARFYVPVAQASDIPALGRRLFDRLILAGYGYAFISKAGRCSIRSVVDAAVWSPERLDFIAGVHPGPGVVQRRGEPEMWHETAPDLLDAVSLPPLTARDEARLSAIRAELLSQARSEAQRIGADYAEKRRAAGHPFAARNEDGGEVWCLDGEHAIQMTDGRWVPVDDILAEPTRFHDKTCADPLEPESYGGDRRIARIYSSQPNPAIHSFAHGGTTYPLRQSAQAAFAVDVTEGERIAAITRQAFRVLFLEAATLTDGELGNRLLALQAAQSTKDPLSDLFHSEVIAVAGRLPAIDRAMFSARLRAALEAQPKAVRWHAATPGDRQLVLKAAFTFFAPIGTLYRSGGRNHAPILDLYAEGETRRWLVDGLLPTPGVAALVGAPGSGKTFIAGHLGGQIASAPSDGKPNEFMDRPVTSGGVLYFASEDAWGVRDRVKKWASVYADPRSQLRLVNRALPLSTPEDALSVLLSAMQSLPKGVPLRLIVVDVFRDSLIGDENSSEISGAALATAHIISRLAGATLLLIHHASRANPDAPRGSTAFDGAVDWMASVARRDSGMVLTVTKNRNGGAGDSATWHVQDGVLRLGRAPGSSETISRDELAAAIARTVWDIATIESPVSKTDLNSNLSVDHPALFGDTLKKNTRRSRISRGIITAIERGWINNPPRGKIVPGAFPPPPEPLAQLEGLV